MVVGAAVVVVVVVAGAAVVVVVVVGAAVVVVVVVGAAVVVVVVGIGASNLNCQLVKLGTTVVGPCFQISYSILSQYESGDPMIGSAWILINPLVKYLSILLNDEVISNPFSSITWTNDWYDSGIQ